MNSIPIMEKQMERNMEDESETGIVEWIIISNEGLHGGLSK